MSRFRKKWGVYQSHMTFLNSSVEAESLQAIGDRKNFLGDNTSDYRLPIVVLTTNKCSR